MTFPDARAITLTAHTHMEKCDGMVTFKVIDPDTLAEVKVKEPCKVCRGLTDRLSAIPVEFLSHCLQEPPTPRLVSSMASFLVESVFERGTHKSRRAQRDLIAGMKVLKEFQDRGGKLRVSH